MPTNWVAIRYNKNELCLSRVNSVTPDVRPSYHELYITLHRDWEAQRPTLDKLLGADLDAINATLTRMGQPAIRPVIQPERRPTRGGG